MQRAFKHQQEVFAKEQKRSEHNISRQPIRKERTVSDTVSPHFHNQQQSSADTTSTRQKLINRLQSASSRLDATGADSKIPTIISGRDRANPFAPETPAEIFTAVKERASAQSEPTNTPKLRFSSRKIPATRSSLASGSIHQEESMARRKYSEEHGLGVPWTTPLIYPKMGKRRETVEYEDLFRLDEDEFLNDNLIGFFLRYLEQHLEQSNPDLAKKVYFYNSYFFERLMQTSKGKKGIDYESVQKWTRNIDIFSRDFVVVPVNESFHWYVVIICNLSKLNTIEDNEDAVEKSRATSKGPAVASIDEADQAPRDGTVHSTQDPPTQQTTDSLSHLSLSEHDKQVDELSTSKNAISPLSSPRQGSTPRKSGPGRRKGARHSLPKYDVTAPIIMTLDSLGLARSSTCTALRQYIVEEARTKKRRDIDGSLIKGMTAKGIPTQSNFSDCGLYLCAYMEKFTLDPAGFVAKILQRQMDPDTDMPMMASEELRSRMRGMIRELHHEQGGNDTEFPIPEVGSILLGPQKAVSSEDNFRAPHTQLQDDSEDELQQDHHKVSILSTVRSPTEALAPAAATRNSAINSNRPREASPPSDPATSMAEILAKIDNSSSSPSKSRSGTKDTAITIDDDDEPHHPTPTKTPISKNDFFDHPSELRDSARVSAHKPPSSSTTTTTSGGTQKAREELSTESHHRSPAHRSPAHRSPALRGQSHESTESFNTQFLRSGQSYNQSPGQGEETRTKKKRTTATGKAQKTVVVMIPDSQEERENDEAVSGEDVADLGGRREESGRGSGSEMAQASQFEVYEDPNQDQDRDPDPDPDPDRDQEILDGV
jgi:Ulp1 protease family, C-terminal catalytic domain